MLSLVLVVTAWGAAALAIENEKSMTESWKIMDGKIPEELQQRMKERTRQQSIFDREGALPDPPWVEFPKIRRGSIGWRMGPGEDYLNGFKDWFSGLDEQRRLFYVELHPEPTDWVGFYSDEMD